MHEKILPPYVFEGSYDGDEFVVESPQGDVPTQAGGLWEEIGNCGFRERDFVHLGRVLPPWQIPPDIQVSVAWPFVTVAINYRGGRRAETVWFNVGKDSEPETLIPDAAMRKWTEGQGSSGRMVWYQYPRMARVCSRLWIPSPQKAQVQEVLRRLGAKEKQIRDVVSGIGRGIPRVLRVIGIAPSEIKFKSGDMAVLGFEQYRGARNSSVPWAIKIWRRRWFNLESLQPDVIGRIYRVLYGPIPVVINEEDEGLRQLMIKAGFVRAVVRLDEIEQKVWVDREYYEALLAHLYSLGEAERKRLGLEDLYERVLYFVSSFKVPEVDVSKNNDLPALPVDVELFSSNPTSDSGPGDEEGYTCRAQICGCSGCDCPECSQVGNDKSQTPFPDFSGLPLFEEL